MRNATFLIKVINDNICVTFMTGRKDYELVLLCKFLQAFSGPRPYVYSSFDHHSVWKTDWQQDITWHVGVLIAVDQGFIKIENKGWPLCRRQFFGDWTGRHRFICIFDEDQYIQRSNEMIFAKLIETRGLWIRVSSEQSAYVVFLGLCFFSLLGFEEIGFRGALDEGGGGLAGESCDIFMQNIVALLTFQLNCLSPYRLLLFFCLFGLFCFDCLSIVCFFLQDSLFTFQGHLALLLLPENIILLPIPTLLCPLLERKFKILFNLDQPTLQIVDLAFQLIICPGGLSKCIGRCACQVNLAQIFVIQGQFGIREDFFPESCLKSSLDCIWHFYLCMQGGMYQVLVDSCRRGGQAAASQ